MFWSQLAENLQVIRVKRELIITQKTNSNSNKLMSLPKQLQTSKMEFLRKTLVEALQANISIESKDRH